MKKLSVSHHAKHLCEAAKSVSADGLLHWYVQLLVLPKHGFQIKDVFSRL